ncbi:hypothetical protein HOD83_01790 [Candidatus Woesearchaeota archaeon]|jgi:lysyl-tRNA synthetase class I|nr:hypothetical protein [Candidatus Woesearchaeota archaeon]MBT4248300.1 hypothetical protein [Candidatus Woesearchaeota archaeon]
MTRQQIAPWARSYAQRLIHTTTERPITIVTGSSPVPPSARRMYEHLIADEIVRALRAQNVEARQVITIGDDEPLRAIASELPRETERYLGRPQNQVMVGSQNFVSYFVNQITDVLDEFGVDATMVTESEMLQQYMPQILRVMENESGELPLFVQCPHCEQLATTSVTSEDDHYTYRCSGEQEFRSYSEGRRDITVRGCGYTQTIDSLQDLLTWNGVVRPRWPIVMAARWSELGATVEPLDQRHLSSSGEVSSVYARAATYYRQLFGGEPPAAIAESWMQVRTQPDEEPLDFFLIQDLFDIMPADILRYTMLRARPRGNTPNVIDLPSVPELITGYDRELGTQYQAAMLASQLGQNSQDERLIMERYAGSYNDDILHMARNYIENYMPDARRLAILEQPATELSEQYRPAVQYLYDNTNNGLAVDDLERVVQRAADRVDNSTAERLGFFQTVYQSTLGRSEGPPLSLMLAVRRDDVRENVRQLLAGGV